ncbi:MAG: hypothetical protein LBV18_05380 [Alistipes sp.]|jgi:YD repeat-containing protein|nr:hypothetical protein [Alistipes sp.]
MKNFITPLAIIVLTALTGCGFPESAPVQLSVVVSEEEASREGVRLTEYEYDRWGNPVAKTQSLNGRTVYEETEFEYDYVELTVTKSHKEYALDGATVAADLKCVTSYWDGWRTAYKFEAFDAAEFGTDINPVPVERWEWARDYSGRPTHYVEEAMGVTNLEYREYEYEWNGKMHVTYTCVERDPESGVNVTKNVTEIYADPRMEFIDSREIKIAGETVEFTTYIYSPDDESLGYMTYAGGDDKTGSLVEQMSPYKWSADGLTVTWSVNRVQETSGFTTFKRVYEIITLPSE